MSLPGESLRAQRETWRFLSALVTGAIPRVSSEARAWARRCARHFASTAREIAALAKAVDQERAERRAERSICAGCGADAGNGIPWLAGKCGTCRTPE